MCDIENERNHHLIVDRENYEENFLSGLLTMIVREESIDEFIARNFEVFCDQLMFQEYEDYITNQIKPEPIDYEEFYYQNLIDSYIDISPEDFIDHDETYTNYYYDFQDTSLKDFANGESKYVPGGDYFDEENKFNDYDYPGGPDENLNGIIDPFENHFDQHYSEIELNDVVYDEIVIDSDYQKLDEYYENLISEHLRIEEENCSINSL